MLRITRFFAFFLLKNCGCGIFWQISSLSPSTPPCGHHHPTAPTVHSALNQCLLWPVNETWMWGQCRPTPPARHINHGGGLLCTQMSLPWSSRVTKFQVNETLDLIADNGQSSLVALGIMTNIKQRLGLLKVIQNGPTFWFAIYPWTFCQQPNFHFRTHPHL